MVESFPLFIAVFALYGVNFIRTRLGAQGFYDTRASLRNKLNRWQRATTGFTTTDGAQIEARCDVRPNPATATITKAAGTSCTPERPLQRLAKP